MLATILSWVVMSAPIWVSLALLTAPPKIVKRLFVVVLLLFVGAFAFGVAHAGDRDPWQWPSAFISMGAFWLLISVGIGWLVNSIRNRYRSASEQASQISGSATNAELDAPSENPNQSPHV